MYWNFLLEIREVKVPVIFFLINFAILLVSVGVLFQISLAFDYC